MRLLIPGATGFIGSHLVKRLLDDGFEITACARTPEKHQVSMPSVRWIHCDFTQDTSKDIWLPRLDDIDVVINAVGIIEEKGRQNFETVQTRTPVALFDACQDEHIKVIQVSAAGADCEGQPDFLESKRLADLHLQGLDTASIVVYPSVVIGKGGQSSELFNAVASFLVTPLFGEGDQVIQPIHINDVTASISHMISNWTEPKQVHQLVGPDVMTLKDLYAALRSWLNLGQPNFVKVPMSLIGAAAKLGDKTGIGMLNSDTLFLLENARTPEATYVGYTIRSLKEALALEPAEKADIWLARTLFVRPLVLWSLITIWIFTAFTSAFFDLDSGYELMAAGGFTGTKAAMAIYGGALFDFVLGVAMMLNYRMRFILSMQMILMLVYMVGIAFIVPAQWLHPFGPVTKNFTLLAATLYLFMTEPGADK